MRPTRSTVRCLLAFSPFALGCEIVEQEPVAAESTTSVATTAAAPRSAATDPAESAAAGPAADAGAAADGGAACTDAGLTAPPSPWAAGVEPTLEEYARWRAATSPTVRLTRRGCPLTIQYQIK